jgi:hypothetical protein
MTLAILKGMATVLNMTEFIKQKRESEKGEEEKRRVVHSREDGFIAGTLMLAEVNLLLLWKVLSCDCHV